MTIRNLKDGNKKPWLCECYPQGRTGKRVRKRFATKGEAAAYENFIMREVDDKPWLGEKTERRSLMEMIDLWQERHGQSLTHSKYTYNKLKVMALGLGDPLYTRLTASMFTEYRAARLAGDIADLQGRKTAIAYRTCNIEQDLLNAVIVELQRMGEWKGDNPLTAVRQFRLHETEMEFLTTGEIRQLIDAAENHTHHDDVLKLIKLCLATGARYSEAANLTGAQITRYKVTFTQTKGKKNRSVPISQEVYELIYKEGSGPLFSIGYTTVYRFIVKHVPRLKQQAAHVLRHTFASYYMMNGGNIIALQRILGHADIKQTMRYAHLAPDHLEDAITKNPLTLI
ncbi:tyrosine-type recombinase/integrase [Photobacterium halotolerans]|uniref:phage integrase n=1 Tax=Photobacterium halotolerans TaxID=265726 RepID=UPI001372777E|nr:tyrosine-type recombinase/integrase [Photobacterium halotolerans]NAW87761.1 tyrosine-type recombinase/integrase [Photobacterium halotolerans]